MRTRRFFSLAAALTLAVLVIAACDDDSDTAQEVRDDVEDVAADVRDDAEDLADDVEDVVTGDHTVTIEDFSFNPDELTISAGDTVTFRNDGSAQHAVVSSSLDGEPYDEIDETIPAGGSVDITFDDSGTYEYFCKFHDSMTGTITVE